MAPDAPANRKQAFREHGLRCLRDRWPLNWTLERYGMWWRYLRLLEKTPEPQSRLRAMPHIPDIAVYTPGHIGDILLTVPLVRALRDHYPQSRIRWIVGSWSKQLAERYVSYASRIEVFSPGWLNYSRAVNRRYAAEHIAWLEAMSRHPADLFVTTAPAGLDTYLVGRSLKPVLWCGRGPELDLYPVACSRQITTVSRDVPEARDILKILEPLGIRNGSDRLEYTVRPEERDLALRLLADSGIDHSARFIIISPAAGWPGKQWPCERWSEVADKLREKGWLIVLVGGKQDEGLCRKVQALMRNHCANLAGQTTLPELAALISMARLWMGCDSGGMHLAAALNVPVVSLFGPTNPSKWGPCGSKHSIIRKVESCDGCIAWHPNARCLHDARCMKMIGADEVCAKAGLLLGASDQMASEAGMSRS